MTAPACHSHPPLPLARVCRPLLPTARCINAANARDLLTGLTICLDMCARVRPSAHTRASFARSPPFPPIRLSLPVPPFSLFYSLLSGSVLVLNAVIRYQGEALQMPGMPKDFRASVSVALHPVTPVLKPHDSAAVTLQSATPAHIAGGTA